MDDISGLTNQSNTFVNFLAVTRKFGYHYVYIFRIILPEKKDWEKTISQTKVFNIFFIFSTSSNCCKVTTIKSRKNDNKKFTY